MASPTFVVYAVVLDCTTFIESYKDWDIHQCPVVAEEHRVAAFHPATKACIYGRSHEDESLAIVNVKAEIDSMPDVR